MAPIMLAHTMVARFLGPEMAINEAEALELARAWAHWRSFYPGVLDPKMAAFMQLLMVAGALDGPRLLRVSARKAAERSERKAAEKAAQGPPAPFGNIINMGPPTRGA